MEHTNQEVQVKYIVSFSGGHFWTSSEMSQAEKDKLSLQTIHSNVTICEVVERIENGTVVERKERRLQ